MVTNMTQGAGSYSDQTTYRYKDPRMHLQGKGFLGFGEIEASNYNKDRKAVTKYGYNTSYFYPFVAEQKITTRSGSNIATSVYENSFVNNGFKRITPYIRKSTTTDHLTGVVKTVECIQTDNWANPLNVVARYGSDVTETVISSYFNSETDNLWVIGLPQSVEKKTTKGSGTWAEKQTFAYNAKYLLQKSIN